MFDDSAVSAALARVQVVDLTAVSRGLHHENPEFWIRETLAQVEGNYRRLLALHILCPGEVLVVNKVLDDYWHAHILDTQKYADDCHQVFGFFLHHTPYFGMNGGEEAQRQHQGFAVTQQLWEEAFGFSMLDDTPLTVDRVLGSYDPARPDASLNRVYAFPQTCKCGQHCNKAIVPETRINPAINPRINPQINPQIRNPVQAPRNVPARPGGG
jgi:hypothetical protein